MQIKNFSEFILNIREKAIPLMVVLEVTNSCNLMCKHCVKVKDEEEKSLSFSDWARIISELKEAGTTRLVITGGEPFVRKDILEILHFISEMGFEFWIETNGTLITPTIADFICKLRGVLFVGFSFYSLDKLKYDNFTQVAGTYDKVMAGIKEVTKRNIKTNIMVRVMNINIDELEDIYKFYKVQEIPIHFSPLIFRREDGNTEPLMLRLNDKEMEKYYTFTKVFDGQDFLKVENYPNLDSHICGAGISSCTITSKGYVKPCRSWGEIAGDLKSEKFIELWSNSEVFKKIRKIKVNDFRDCIKCNLLKKCKLCPTFSYMETNRYFAINPEMCRITKIKEHVYCCE